MSIPITSAALASSLVLLTGAALPTATAAPLPARASVECTGTHLLNLAPGLGVESSTGPAHSTGAGPFSCNDGRKGTIRFDGRYGTSGTADCASGGDAWGVFEIRFRGERTPMRDTLTTTFGGIAKGLVTGTFESEHMRGRYTAVPTRGDCLTSALKQVRINLVAKMTG